MRALLALCLLPALQAGPIALEPDFELVSFTPKDGSTLSGHQALTAVFNLAVIPLGADLKDGPLPEDYVPFILRGVRVPGHLRWVSSSTARFDPSVPWPSDLQDVSVDFNTRLTSVSGKGLRNAVKTRHFSTAPLTYWVREVRSETLDRLTEKRWSSSLEEEKFKPKNAQECPKDAKVLVDFNFPVEVQRFIREPSMFELVEGSIFSQTWPISEVSECPNEGAKPLHLELGEAEVVNQSRCLAVSLPKTLASETAYTLSLRKGVRYHPFAGSFAGGEESEKIKLMGLRPFRFNFLRRHYGREFFKIYLRHGLKEEMVEPLGRAMSLTDSAGQALAHELTLVDNCTLQMQVRGLQPEREYSIHVAADERVVDGVGLPLQAAKGRLQMVDLPGVFLAPQPPNPSLWSSSAADRFLPTDAPATFPLLQRRLPKRMISERMDPEALMQAFVCSIATTDELGAFLTFFFSPSKADPSVPGPCSTRSFEAHPGVILVAGAKEIQYNEVPLHFSRSRLLFLEFTCVGDGLGAHCATERPASRVRFVNAAGFTALTALSEDPRPSVLVAVHNLSTQEPVVNAQVELWEIPGTRWTNGRSVQPEARRLRTERTDAHGRALFEPDEERRGRQNKGYVAVVSHPESGEILLGDLLRLTGAPKPRDSSVRVYATTDRAVYAPGDALAILGLVASRHCKGGMCSPSQPDGALVVGEFIWRLQRPGEQEVCSLHLWPVSKMGMFTANISVPTNASTGRIPAVSLYWSSGQAELPTTCHEWRREPRTQLSAEYTPFLEIKIADPRPPSAVLTLGAPHFLLPGESLELNATLETYTGIPLQQQELKVELSVGEETRQVQGLTDAWGRWAQELPFGSGDLPKLVPKLGDELKLKVTARGPTGEMLTESKRLPLRVGPWDLGFRTSADTQQADGPLPGQQFAVWTSLKAKYPAEGWRLREHLAAQISLIPAEGPQESCQEWLEAQALSRDDAIHRICLKDIDPGAPARCDFTLPAGRYAVVARVDMQHERSEHVLQGCHFVGRSTKAWRRRPLPSPNLLKRFEVRPMARYYVPGDTVKLEVWNPLPRSRLLVIWGARPAVSEVEDVAETATVDLGVLKDEDCPSAVCKVQVYLWTLEQKLLEGVPSSIHYPSGAPLWAQQELELRIERPRQSLELRLEPSRREVAPGGDVDVEVRLKQSRQAQTEVALLVVDKAWLDLQPLELLEPLDAMEPRQAASGQWRLASSLDGLASGRSLTRATERIRRSFKENPWMGYIGWPLSLRGSDESILDDEHYINKWAEELTDFPPQAFGGFGGGVMFKSARGVALESAPVSLMAPVADMAYAEMAPEAPKSPAAPLRKRFAKLVALNRALLEVGTQTWSTRISLPEDLSSYVVRVVAVSKEGGNWSWGAAETEVHTSQQVYGKPLLPRMLRFADVCRLGVVVTAAAGGHFTVEALEPRNLRLLGKGERHVVLRGTSLAVRFTFAADLALGAASVAFRVRDAATGRPLDLVQASLEVLPQQQGLRLKATTSVRAAQEAVVQKEAVAALRAVPGSGEMSLSASVGMQAPLLNALLELGPTSDSWRPQGDSILAILLGGLVLRRAYGTVEASNQGLETAIAAAEGRLGGQVLVDPFLGFVSTPPEHRWRLDQQQPELESNTLALLVLRMAGLLGAIPATWAPLEQEALARAAYKAIELRREDWQRCCQRDVSLGSFIGHSQLALFFLALPDAKTRLASLWQETSQSGLKDPGSEVDLLVILASAQLGRGMVPSFDGKAKIAAEALLDRVRVQGPTAYFAESRESMHAASAWVQALAVWLWSGTEYAKHPFAPLVASYVLSGERCPWQRHLPARQILMASLGLGAFDMATGSGGEADLSLEVVGAGKRLLEAHLKGERTMVATAWPWNQLPTLKNGMDLEIQAKAGSGLAVVSYGLDFVPMMPFSEPQFRGILVQKIVQRMGPGSRCTGAVRGALPGETLCVSLSVTSPDDLQEVQVIDLVASGLEPIEEEEEPMELFSFRPSWRREIRHDTVVWRSGFLWAGTHSLSYTCLANAPGIYSMPAAKAFSARHPEVMGLSGASNFMVEEAAASANAVSGPELSRLRAEVWSSLEVEAHEQSTPTAPKPCPQACPKAGSCNVAKGRCECASSAGQMLPCEEVTLQVQAPFSKLLGPRKGLPTAPELHVEGETSNMPSSDVVITGLLLSLIAAGSYFFAKMMMPRNLAHPELEMSQEPFTALSDRGMRRREGRGEEGGLVPAEAAE